MLLFCAAHVFKALICVFLIHLLSFVAPAVFVAAVLAAGARLVWRKKEHLLPWYWMAGINALLGIVVLAMGLVLYLFRRNRRGQVLSGQDGRMMTYAALVLALGSCQWLMSGGWRKGR